MEKAEERCFDTVVLIHEAQSCYCVGVLHAGGCASEVSPPGTHNPSKSVLA